MSRLNNKFLRLIVCFLAILSQLLITGCKTESLESNNTLPTQIEILQKAIDCAPEGEYDISLGTVWDSDCPSFETSLLRLTDIVKASYRTSKQFSGHYAHIFEVKESVKGKIEEKIIYVWAYNQNRDGHEDSNKIKYNKGEKYLLLLERHSDPFLSFDTFISVHPNLYIPLNYKWELDISAARICNFGLVSFLKDENLKQACENDQFISYVQQITQNNPNKKPLKGFTETYDKEFAIQNSEYILQIDISSKMIGTAMPFSLDPHIQLYEVSVEKENILSGNEKTLSEIITVYLPVTIAEGSYIIAVNNSQDLSNKPHYIPSTRNSIYTVSARQEIIDFLR